MNGMTDLDEWLETSRGYVRCADIQEVYVWRDTLAKSALARDYGVESRGEWQVVVTIRHQGGTGVGVSAFATYEEAWSDVREIARLVAGVSPVSG